MSTVSFTLTDGTRELPSSYQEWLTRAREQAGRFWSKVDRSGPEARAGLGACWLWQAAVDKDGYGKFQITGRGARYRGDRPVQKHVRSHRLAWELAHGPVPDGLLLLHACDTPACCNPAHLSPGTQQQNRQDSKSRGRTVCGGDHPMAKLTEASVRDMRRFRAEGQTLRALAAHFGVSKAACASICSRKTWREVA